MPTKKPSERKKEGKLGKPKATMPTLPKGRRFFDRDFWFQERRRMEQHFPDRFSDTQRLARGILAGKISGDKVQAGLEYLNSILDPRKPMEVRAFVAGFLEIGADNIVIQVLRKKEMYTLAGMVEESRSRWGSAGLLYFEGNDLKNLRRLGAALKADRRASMIDPNAVNAIKDYIKRIEHDQRHIG